MLNRTADEFEEAAVKLARRRIRVVQDAADPCTEILLVERLS
jgi:hypothetical protein